MPPMSVVGSRADMMRPTDTVPIKKTNFSIAAIMAAANNSTEAVKQEVMEDDEEEEVDVGLEEEKDSSLEKVRLPVKLEKPAKGPRVVERSTCPALNSVKCVLENKELWEKFLEFGTEMIITRTGRRMFPTMRVSFSQVEVSEPGTKYLVLLDIVPCDNKRYRYAYHRSAWLVAGKADPPPPHRLYAHPDGPFTADQLRKQVISFEKVKVTNNETDNTGQVMI